MSIQALGVAGGVGTLTESSVLLSQYPQLSSSENGQDQRAEPGD